MSETDKHVLLVEDDLGDVLLIRRGLERGVPAATLHVVQSGHEALDFLRRDGGFRNAPRPQLIILDLHMAGLSGLEVLRAVKQDPDLSPIPVVVFSASRAEEDIQAVYQAQANGYVCKPIGLGRVVQELVHYFLNVSCSPL